MVYKESKTHIHLELVQILAASFIWQLYASLAITARWQECALWKKAIVCKLPLTLFSLNGMQTCNNTQKQILCFNLILTKLSAAKSLSCAVTVTGEAKVAFRLYEKWEREVDEVVRVAGKRENTLCVRATYDTIVGI